MPAHDPNPPSSSQDGDLLARVTDHEDFFGSVLCRDSVEDWGLARDLGEFLLRILPDPEMMGHAILARACRHLGETARARQELEWCLSQMEGRDTKGPEEEILSALLEKERRLLLHDQPGP